MSQLPANMTCEASEHCHLTTSPRNFVRPIKVLGIGSVLFSIATAFAAMNTQSVLNVDEPSTPARAGPGKLMRQQRVCEQVGNETLEAGLCLMIPTQLMRIPGVVLHEKTSET